MHAAQCEIVECPICIDEIDMSKNCVKTECGHWFHASCLLTNIAHNGFGCPYCRTVMADEIADEEEEYEEDDGEEDGLFNDSALRGFRFFMNNLEGDNHDEEDVNEEDAEIEDTNVVEVVEDAEIVAARPTAEFIAQSLLSRGVTMEDLVKCLLTNHEEYEAELEQLDRHDGEIFGKMRIIISNYMPPVPVADTPIAAVENNSSEQTSREHNYDFRELATVG